MIKLVHIAVCEICNEEKELITRRYPALKEANDFLKSLGWKKTLKGVMYADICPKCASTKIG